MDNVLYLRCNEEEFKDIEFILFKQEYPEFLSDYLVKNIVIYINKEGSPGDLYCYKLTNIDNKLFYITN